MWKIRPNFSHLYSPIMSRVKYSTNYVKRVKFNEILYGCGKIDLIRTNCDILDRKWHMRKMRPNFSHLYSPKMCYLFDIWPNIALVSNSIEFFAAVKHFRRIRHSHDIYDRIHHMWKIRPNFSHLYSPKISHVKYPTKYIKSEEFDRIRHRCEQLDLIRHSYDIFDRIRHIWKIRPNFSHLYSPIRPRVRCLTDYIKHEKFNDILHICGKIDRIHRSCDKLDIKHVKNPTEFLTPTFAENIKCKVPTEYVKHEEYDRIIHRCEQFDQIRQSHHIFIRIHHMWKIRPNFSHLRICYQNVSM